MKAGEQRSPAAASARNRRRASPQTRRQRCPAPCARAIAPVHRAVRVMRAHAGERREDDGRHRRGERQVHQVLGRKALARVNTNTSIGTMIMPPPMPSRPARKPTTSADREVGRATTPSARPRAGARASSAKPAPGGSRASRISARRPACSSKRRDVGDADRVVEEGEHRRVVRRIAGERELAVARRQVPAEALGEQQPASSPACRSRRTSR